MYFIAVDFKQDIDRIRTFFGFFFFRYERETNGIDAQEQANIHEHKHIELDTLHNTIKRLCHLRLRSQPRLYEFRDILYRETTTIDITVCCLIVDVNIIFKIRNIYFLPK